MPVIFNHQIRTRPKQIPSYVIVALSLFVLSFLFSECTFGADAGYAIHQRILAGEQVSLNPSAPEDARTIDATWIKEAALRHVKIEIYHAVIEGPLDAQEVTFEQGFTLGSCTIKGYADFSHAVFKRDFFASDTIFRSWANFRWATFERTATLQRARFEGSIGFEDAHFVGTFDAAEVKVSKAAGAASFSRVRFDDAASFPFSQFDCQVSFISTQFGGQGYFPGAKFGGSVDFERAHFADVATFGSYPSSKKYAATFVGKAFFDQVQFDSSAYFDEVTFESGGEFFGTTFRSGTYFRGTTFKSLCNFFTARFENNAWFMGAKFLGDVRFDSAHVAGSLFFRAEKPLPAAIFRGEAGFTNIQVQEVVDFEGGSELTPGAVFVGKALFSMAKFGGPSNFQGVEFKGDAEFTDAVFENDVYFPGATFEGAALFDRVQIMGAALFSRKPGAVASGFAQPAHFEHDASFSGARFGSEVRFIGVRFDEKVDFAGAHFENDAHFEDSVFLGPSSFRSVIFRAVYFSPLEAAGKQQFMNDVDLLGCTYDRIQIDWRSLLRYPNGQSRIHPYDRQPYIELEAALRRSGSGEDADAVYAERHRVERQTLTGLPKVEDCLYWLTTNYGIDLWREFFLTLFFLGIGVVTFSRPGAVQTATGEQTKISWYEAWSLAFHQFLPFGLPVKPAWTPSQRILCKYTWPFRKASAYANFLQIVGWILIPLAAASLAGFLRHGGQ
jgi:uncharacterized protein YjbI with pentapeptide repeats